LLVDFKGSIITITHDRSFLDNVATALWNWTAAS